VSKSKLTPHSHRLPSDEAPHEASFMGTPGDGPGLTRCAGNSLHVYLGISQLRQELPAFTKSGAAEAKPRRVTVGRRGAQAEVDAPAEGWVGAERGSGSYQRVRPAVERPSILDRHAQQLGNHHHRQGMGEVRHRVPVPPLFRPIQGLPRQRLDP
jgi:hypothetical protein